MYTIWELITWAIIFIASVAAVMAILFLAIGAETDEERIISARIVVSCICIIALSWSWPLVVVAGLGYGLYLSIKWANFSDMIDNVRSWRNG